MTGCFKGYHRILLPLVVIMPLLAIFTLTTPALAAPVVLISPGAGAIGTDVTLQGNNFDSYIGDNIAITFDTTEIPTSPLEIPATGSFTTEFTIPENATPGRHWLTVYSTSGTVSMLARASFTVEETLISLDITEGPVGTEVNITGQGFYSGRIVSIYYTNITAAKIGSATGSATGTFTYSFAIPGSIGGSHNITAINDKGNQAESEFEVEPTILVNLPSAGAGELVAMTGTGFGDRDLVDISIGAYPITTVRTSDTGDFEVVFNIPSGIHPGIYDIEALDESSNRDEVSFTVTTAVGISHTSGPVGITLTVNGSGFTPGEPVSVTYDDITVATTAVDNFGRFTTSFNVPSGTAGSHQITVTDGTFTENYTFVVESEAPSIPLLRIPVENTETRAMAYFDWYDVDDPSQPVVYRLQIAAGQNFSTIVLDKSDLPDSEYTLDETLGEALAASGTGTTYYWRVKAIDAASNAGEWSDAWPFIVTPPQTPELLYPDIDTTVAIPISFNWEDVSSLNPPVTYNLQIDTDLSFSPLVLEVIGLSDSEYRLSDSEYLPETGEDVKYYWRIKAVDYAKNESEWSNPGSFYVQGGLSFPAWAVYTLIGIAAIMVGYLAYWIGRRTSSKSPE